VAERRGVYNVVEQKPEINRPFGIPSRRWEDNIKMVLQEVGSGMWEYGLDRAGLETGGGHLCMR
jgi:hypothetical protein